MHPFRKLYDSAYDFPYREEGPTLSYFLAAIPRTGSTLLTIRMWEKGLLGAPLEYWNLRDREEDIVRCGAGDLLSYWSNVRKRRTSQNGVFGSKLFTGDIKAVFTQQPEALRLITADKVIQVRRRDLIQQAISYSRAKQSHVWIAGTPDHTEDAVSYHFDYIVDSMKAIRRQEISWEKIIERTEAEAIKVYYENFESDPDTEIDHIAAFLGVSGVGPKLIELPPISKQRDALSTEWLDRFNEELDNRRMNYDELLIA